MGWLLLGIDSLVACIAVGALLTKRQWVPFALMFGLADGLGTLLGITLHWSVPEVTSTVVATAFMVGLGIYWLAVSAVSERMSGTGWVWLVPWVLTIDNITYGGIDNAWSSAPSVQALETGLSSVIQAGAGIAVSVVIARMVPRAIRAMRSSQGGNLVAAGGSGGGSATASAGTATISSSVVLAVAGVAVILAAVVNVLLD